MEQYKEIPWRILGQVINHEQQFTESEKLRCDPFEQLRYETKATMN